jgi:putative glutamine amidotransferase
MVTSDLGAVAEAPVIAMTYSSAEFTTWPLEAPWPAALQSVVAAGGVPLAIDCAIPQPRLGVLLDLADGLIVLGGGDIAPETVGGDPDDPTVSGVNMVRDSNELAAFEIARDRRIRTLAICRGFQLCNVGRGGSLIADLPRDRPGDVQHQPGMSSLMATHHTVEVEPETTLARWIGSSGSVQVNSQHHQAVGRVGDGLRVTARAGDGLVEAFETDDGLVVGVQWHPEFIWSVEPTALSLLKGFIASCRGDRVARSSTSEDLG